MFEIIIALDKVGRMSASEKTLGVLGIGPGTEGSHNITRSGLGSHSGHERAEGRVSPPCGASVSIEIDHQLVLCVAFEMI